MGLKLGDKLVLNVLGREIEGTHRQLPQGRFHHRQPEFHHRHVARPDRPCAAFVPGDGARRSPGDEEKLYRAVTDAFPNISTVRVKDAIAQVERTAPATVSDGVRAASLLTILSGLLVLAGAIAAGSRSRLYDATVLKVLGATRARIAAGLRHRIWRARAF